MSPGMVTKSPPSTTALPEKNTYPNTLYKLKPRNSKRQAQSYRAELMIKTGHPMPWELFLGSFCPITLSCWDSG